MGTFKGYSLLIGSNSTESERLHVRVPVYFIIPVGVVLGVILSLFLYSSVNIGKYAWIQVQYIQSIAARDSLSKNLTSLTEVSDNVRAEINFIIDEDNKRRLMYGLAPVDTGALKVGIGGTQPKSQAAYESFEHQDIIEAFRVQEHFEFYARQSIFIDSTLKIAQKKIEKKQTILRETPSIWPAEGRYTSGYGYRYHPVLKTRAFHDGLDIANKEWTPIIAPADGICTKSEMTHHGYGKVIHLEHAASGYETRYAHLNDMVVKEGDQVKRGQLIGYMGNTGRSTGSHLHYELVKNDRKIDPKKYLVEKVKFSSK